MLFISIANRHIKQSDERFLPIIALCFNQLTTPSYRNPCGANYAYRDEGRADPAPTSHDLLL